MSEKEKHLHKLKKLLALARNNSSPEEAALAMNRAQELMARHNLKSEDAELTDISEASTDKAPSHAEKMPEYMALLACMISRVFGVKFYSSYGRDFIRGRSRTITFYGPSERPQIASYAFEVLGRQLMKARRAYLSTLRRNIKSTTKTARADTYCSYWVNGAYQMVSDLLVTESEETLMESYFRRRLSSGMTTQEPRSPGKARGTDDAAITGYHDGSNARLHHGVNGCSSSVLKIGGAHE
ncbi:DUF2786 domain-containing protein [Candidatus Pantoea formicae]|uniref:DUF2786 domain-containing protein n=1 Tax=Candidatus Pantoea formicae TaxID=2608355 RepID=UPI003ED937F8